MYTVTAAWSVECQVAHLEVGDLVEHVHAGLLQAAHLESLGLPTAAQHAHPVELHEALRGAGQRHGLPEAPVPQVDDVHLVQVADGHAARWGTQTRP